MDLSEWRKAKSEGIKHTLPSGLVVRLRRVQLMDLASQGQIPAPLMGAAGELIESGKTDLTLENWPHFEEVFNLVAKSCIIDPPVVVKGDDQHLGIDELSASDKLAIYNWANQVLAAVLPFREKRNGDEGAGHAGQEIRDEAIEDHPG
jgi:hypothetical protein